MSEQNSVRELLNQVVRINLSVIRPTLDSGEGEEAPPEAPQYSGKFITFGDQNNSNGDF